MTSYTVNMTNLGLCLNIRIRTRTMCNLLAEPIDFKNKFKNNYFACFSPISCNDNVAYNDNI